MGDKGWGMRGSRGRSPSHNAKQKAGPPVLGGPARVTGAAFPFVPQNETSTPAKPPKPSDW